MRILQLLDEDGGRMRQKDIVEKLDAHHTSVHRALKKLMSRGNVVNENGLYSCSSRDSNLHHSVVGEREQKMGNVFTLHEGQEKKDDIADMVRNMRNFLEDTSQTLEIYRMRAQMQKMKYDALLEEGFTEFQALEIVKQGDVL